MMSHFDIYRRGIQLVSNMLFMCGPHGTTSCIEHLLGLCIIVIVATGGNVNSITEIVDMIDRKAIKVNLR